MRIWMALLAVVVPFCGYAQSSGGGVFHSIRDGMVEVTSFVGRTSVPAVSMDVAEAADSVAPVASTGHVALPLRHIRVTSCFGMRVDPMNHRSRRRHNGLDLGADFQPVFAMLDGVVSDVGYSRDGGVYVTLDHLGFVCCFMHLSRVEVAPGMRVLAGQQVAVSGNSGRRTTGPHLHVSCRWNLPGSSLDGKFFDPERLLGMIADFRGE